MSGDRVEQSRTKHRALIREVATGVWLSSEEGAA